MIRRIYQFLLFINDSVQWATGNKSHVLMSAGFGLGLGLGLILAFMPAPIQAQAEYPRGGVGIEAIKSTDLGMDVDVASGETSYFPEVTLSMPAVHLVGSGSLGQNRPIVIQGTQHDFSFQNMSTAQPGDEIFVVGSNGGWYRFVVVETKTYQLDELNQLSKTDQPLLILMKLNSWQRTAQVVMARLR